jgi:hypothetical protein
MMKRSSLVIAILIVILSACSQNQVVTEDGSDAVEGSSAELTDEAVGITVTFDGDRCIYNGLERLPVGRILVALDVRDQTAYAYYGFVVYTLDEDKTLEDLVAAPFISSQPVWAHEQAYIDELESGGYQEKTAMIVDSPIYLVCVVQEGEQTDLKITNVLGPIEVVP